MGVARPSGRGTAVASSDSRRYSEPMSASAGVLAGGAPAVGPRLRRLTWLALGIRLAVAIVIHTWVPEQMFAPDQLTYHQVGRAIADSWSYDLASLSAGHLQSGPRAYFYIVAVLYYFFGAFPLIPKLVNAVVGAAAVPLVYDLAVRMGASVPAALKAAVYTVWFPSLVLWAALNIRDTWIVLLILFICREALVLRARPGPIPLFLLTGAVLSLVQFRDYVLFAVAGPMVVSLLVQRSRNVARNLIIGSLAAAVVIYADQVAGGVDRKARLIDLQELNEIRYWNTVGAASGFERADISTPTKALLYLPRGLALFLLAPFPWELSSVRQVLALPETLFFYWLIPWMLRGIRHLVRHHFQTSLMVLMVTAGLTLGYSLGEGNAGTAYRHRAQLLCFFLVYAAVGQHQGRRRAEVAIPSALPRSV